MGLIRQVSGIEFQIPVNEIQHVLRAELILCQESVNPSQELLSLGRSGDYGAGGDGGFRESLRCCYSVQQKMDRVTESVDSSLPNACLLEKGGDNVVRT